MRPQSTCNNELIPRSLVIVNWSTVLIGTSNDCCPHKWSFNIPSWSSYTAAVKSGADQLTLIADKLEMDAAGWDEDFIPCSSLSFGVPLNNSNLMNQSLLQDDQYSSLDLRATRYVILLAFSWHVWYSLFAILVLISFLLHAVLRREEAVVHAGSEAPPWETSEVLLATIGAICQQGSHRHPDTAAARTIFMSLFILSVIIYTAFSAAFVALLSPPVHNQHHDEVLTHLNNHRAHYIEKFPNEHMASILLKSRVHIIINKYKPHNPAHNCSIVIQSKGEKSIMDAIGQIIVSGTTLHIEDNQLAFDENKLGKISSLTMKDAYPAFLLLASGGIIALIILIIEIMEHQQNHGNKVKPKSVKTSRKSAKYNSRTRFIN